MDIPLDGVAASSPDGPSNLMENIKETIASVVDEPSFVDGVAPTQGEETVGVYQETSVKSIDSTIADAGVANVQVSNAEVSKLMGGNYDLTFNPPTFNEFKPMDISELKIAPDTMVPVKTDTTLVTQAVAPASPVLVVREAPLLASDPIIQEMKRVESRNPKAVKVADDRIGQIQVARHPFVARDSHELTVQRGDLVQIDALHKDGFAHGTNLNTVDRHVGLFPIGILSDGSDGVTGNSVPARNEVESAQPMATREVVEREVVMVAAAPVVAQQIESSQEAELQQVGPEMAGVAILPFIQELPRSSSLSGDAAPLDDRNGKIYAANLPFAARAADETSLRPGDYVRVDQVYSDGFAKGENESLSKAGFFPVGCLNKEELVKHVVSTVETKEAPVEKWVLPEDYGEYGKTVQLSNGDWFTPRPAPEYKSEDALAKAASLSWEPMRTYASPAQNYPQTVTGARAIGLSPLFVEGMGDYEGERPGPYVKPDVDKLTNRLIAPNVYDNPYVYFLE
jgi:hypothetical protein